MSLTSLLNILVIGERQVGEVGFGDCREFADIEWLTLGRSVFAFAPCFGWRCSDEVELVQVLRSQVNSKALTALEEWRKIQLTSSSFTGSLFLTALLLRWTFLLAGEPRVRLSALVVFSVESFERRDEMVTDSRV